MRRVVISVLGAGFVLMGAMLFSGGLFRSGVAEAAFPGADSLNVSSQTALPDGTGQATFSWVSYNTGPQWLDISTDPSFSFGFMQSSGALPSGQNSFVWNELQPGVTYFARVNTLTAFGWIPSAPVSFTVQGNGVAPYGYYPWNNGPWNNGIYGYFGYGTPGYSGPTGMFPPITNQPGPVQAYPYY